MKFSTVTLLIFGLFTIITSKSRAQNIPLGPQQSEQSSELSDSDATIEGNRHYKNIQIDLRAGEGAMLYMIARDFKPQLLTLDLAETQWGYGKISSYLDNSMSSYIGITAQHDTSFYAVYTSYESGSTGPFVYGLRKLTPEQMKYTHDMSMCDKIIYLINQWQCFFQVIPGTTLLQSGVWQTSNTLITDNSATIPESLHYKEYLYSNLNGTDALNAYNKIVNDLKACLSADQWTISSTIDVVEGEAYDQTFFTITGSKNMDHLASFSIQYIEMDGNDAIYLEFY